MKKELRKSGVRLRPEWVMMLGFALIILCGSLLLMLPFSSKAHCVTSFSDTLFTSVSATCVTGLVVLDTATHWSTAGQWIILGMIQLGGLGFMSFALLLVGLFSRRVSPGVRNLTALSLGMESMDEMPKLIRRIFIGTFSIEGIGAILLMLRFIPLFGWKKGIFTGIFLSVSAFCNAGFDVLGGDYGAFSSLCNLPSDPFLLFVLAILIILGAAGFLVWNDLWELLRHRKKMRVYTKFVLLLTLGLLFGGMLLLLLLEWNNPATLGSLSVGEKLCHAFFQSATTRTAGFDAIGQTGLTECGKAVSMLLMFIGGASASTAGGIKVGTFGVLMVSIWATLRGRKETCVFHRKITEETVRRALCLTFFVLFCILTFAVLITTADGVPLEASLYECFSAFCTVGLSLSLTPTLCIFSRVLLMLAMFCGRVGVLTLSYALMRGSADADTISHPAATMLIG